MILEKRNTILEYCSPSEIISASDVNASKKNGITAMETIISRIPCRMLKSIPWVAAAFAPL